MAKLSVFSMRLTNFMFCGATKLLWSSKSWTGVKLFWCRGTGAKEYLGMYGVDGHGVTVGSLS